MDINSAIKVIGEKKLIACVRSDSPAKVTHIVDALKAGGISCIELTMTVPDPFNQLKRITLAHPDLLIGMGTVLDAKDARKSIECGASFIVSPVLSEGILRYCSEAGVLSIPGIMTPNEMFTAMQAGAGIVKLFPASVAGPKFIREIRGPFPDAKIIPSGGVTVENAAEWLHAGAYALVMGGSVVSPAQEGNYGEISLRAAAAVKAISR
ncbi:MAG TPA: bifunctional 4-hydroxy-2-oxoglutarate aldolase/2-dehydro-3-deoxy-phosphogluconate aldolase [Spirochaetota bacterium]|nr:bifunctional 4-hydroxy-2-oxoglutarate aldolase/2-dehydro-3-deoxy-phosphogluconate aldolase [Spirochaetota bacterium]